jgi:hypothetical protein
MSSRYLSTRRFGFWVGPLLVVGSLQLGGLLCLLGITLYPLIPLVLLLLLLPAVGLLVGVLLIVRGTQPRWAKLLALSPVLVPGLLVLLVLAVTWLPSSPNRLVFLIPDGFRGRVSLSRQHDMPERFPREDGRATLYVPPYGNLSTSEPLGADDLAHAEYYLVDTKGQRLRQLRQLDERVFEQRGPRQGPGEPVDPQEVGVFTAGHRHKRPYQATPFTTNYPSEISYNPQKEVNGLVFTVSCYDSLAVILRRPSF